MTELYPNGQPCKNCGKPVGFSYVTKMYCNERCHDRYKRKSGYHRRKYRDTYPKILLKVCFVCHGNFEPATNHTKYCSKQCRMMASKGKPGKKIKIGIPLEIFRKVKILGLL